MKLSPQELGSVLAGLRLLQHMGDEARWIPEEIDAITSNGGAFKPMDTAQIDRLCERLNR